MPISARWHAQKQFLRKVYNRQVNEWFRDVTNDDDLSTPRKAAKSACLITSEDSQNLALIKMTTFFKLVNPNAEFPIIYGLPDTAFRDVVKFKPQVRLYFRGYTDRQTTDEIAKKLEGQVSFRLMDENYSTSAINSLALKVKNKFRNFFYQRGDALYTYTDQRRGYHFQLYVGGEIAAKKVIEAVNDVAANTTLDWTLLKNHSRNQDLPKIKGKLTVMGETRTIKNVTRSGRVYFAYAELFIPDWGEPITLVDGTGTRPRAIEVF